MPDHPSYHQTISELLLAELDRGKVVTLLVTSTSMAPILQAGDQIGVQKCPVQNLRRGDMILIRRETDYVTHRLIDTHGQNWIAKGDNSHTADLPFSEADILGRVTAITKNRRTISMDHFRWKVTNSVLGMLSSGEARAVNFGRLTRFPFRVSMRLIQWFNEVIFNAKS
jgi:signal peptidase I